MVKIPESWRQRPGLWLMTAAYITLIYLTLPLAPAAEKLLFTKVDKAVVLFAINASMALVAIAALTALARTGRTFSLLLLPLVAVGVALFLEGRNPMERMHILEYGLLALMFHFACGRPKGWQRLLPLVLTCLAGAVDETIQGFLPNRYADIWDVVMNTAGGALGLWLVPAVLGEGREILPAALAPDLPART